MKKTIVLIGFMICSSFATAQTPACLRGASWSFQQSGGVILRSMNGVFKLKEQGDGNLVLYKNGNTPIWASQTQGKNSSKVRFQDDGNLVIYDSSDRPIWASNSNNKGGSYLVLQDDGNLVIYTVNNQPIWATNTGGL